MPEGEASDSPPAPEASRKEKTMGKQDDSKSSLLDIMPGKRPGQEATGAAGDTATNSGAETFISAETVVDGKIRAK